MWDWFHGLWRLLGACYYHEWQSESCYCGCVHVCGIQGRQNQFCPFRANHVCFTSNYISHFAPLRHQYVWSCRGPFWYMVCHLWLSSYVALRVTAQLWHYSDFNDDDAICEKDLNKAMDLLTGGKIPQTVKDKVVEHVRLVTVYLLLKVSIIILICPRYI